MDGKLIDSVGTYRGTILDESVSLSTGGYPQWVARLAATQKWIDDKESMDQLQLAEPTYVDWSGFEEEITAYMILFKSQDTFNADTALLNYEQVQKATGWDGSEFESLNGSNKGKEILFRVQSREYQGKTRLGVEWIDAADANPERQLRKLDAVALKGLSAKLSIKPKVKAVSAPTKPAPTPAAATATAAVPVASTRAVMPSPAPTQTAAKRGPKPKAVTSPPASPKAAEKDAEALIVDKPKETTKLDAWNFLVANKGKTTDSEIQDAWLSSVGEISQDNNDLDEAEFTPAQWAKVRDTVVRDLALSVA